MSSTHPSSRRVVRLTWDVLLLVFQLSDVPTLALLGRVSLDFLTATSPLLYRDVEISSLKQLRTLFCEKKEITTPSEPSRIDPYLSLTQLQSLVLDFSSDPSVLDLNDDGPPFPLDFSRLSSSSPLPIDCLQLCYGPQKCEELLTFLLSTLLPHLNPTRCAHKNKVPFWLRVWDGSPLAGWTRIRTLRLGGIFPFICPDDFLDDNPLMLGFLPRARSVQLVRLEFGHDCWKTGADIEKEVIPELLNVADSNDPMGFSHLKDGTVVLEVDSEERRDAAEKLVSSLVRTKEKFRVELVQ
ncbi:hypothetical protein BDY24DRAFT_391529 [Mrakia frigida]|uniref:uncharacterized protein n=1 Tax=Mrakia frigida TaxID=29902 RepID=UPI003FCBEF69